MTDRLVVGVDGSPESAKALHWAVTEAGRVGLELELVYALALSATADAYGVTVALPEFDDVERYAEDVLSAAERQARAWAPELVVTSRVVVGPAGAVLAEVSEGKRGLVVGSRGLGALFGALLGSVSARVATHAASPVYVIPHDDSADPTAVVPEGGPVVVGVDGSPASDAALRLALDLAASHTTGVRVVGAYQTPATALALESAMVDEFDAAQEAHIAEVVDDALARVRTDADAGVPVEILLVRGRPVDAIIEASKDAVLTVVGSRGRGAVLRLALGSVSRAVLHQATRPVAVVHAGDLGEIR